MSQIFQSFAFAENDTTQERMEKLYLGIISVGEDLYCKGSVLSELTKQLDQYERIVADMRKELDALRGRIKLTTLQCDCSQEWLIEGTAIGKRVTR